MAIIPVAQWVPDAAALGNPGSTRIINALPSTTSYQPFPELSTITSALDAYARGAIAAVDFDLNSYNYAGDAAKLYVLDNTTWTDASKSGGYSTATEERWDFVRWKNKVLGTNFSDSPQQITMGGATFSDLTTDFRARTIAAVRDFVVVGNTFDSTDGAVTDRVRWSAFNDETDWTVSPTTGSDFRDLNAGGQIQRIMGGEFGVIFSERSTWRMSYVGAPTWFQIDEVVPGIGLLAPGAATRLGDTVYFLSENGFVALSNGTGAKFIGSGRVDRFIAENLDSAFLHRVSAVADPRAGRIAWAYPGPGNTNGRPNRIIIYDAKLDKWALVEKEVELLWRAAATGVSLEGLDAFSSSIETLDASLDSSQWKGGAPEFAAFDTDNKSGFFTGSPMPAEIETKETEINRESVTMLNGFRPLVDGGTVTARVASRNRQSDPVTKTAELSMRATGRITARVRARYHRIIMSITGEWRDAIGVQVEARDARRAGRRG